MFKTIRRPRRLAYGDYIDRPTGSVQTTPGQYGTFNQDLNKALSSQELLPNDNMAILRQQETNTTKQPTNWNSNWSNIGGYAGAIGSQMSNSKEFNQESSYIKDRNKTKETTDAALGAVSAVFPVVGGFMKLGEGVGEATMDDDGIYTDKTGQFIDQNLNPVTGVQGVSDTLKSDDLGAWVSQLTAGVSDLFGTKSASQQRAIKAKKDMDMKAAWEKKKQYQSALANYPVEGYGKYGLEFRRGGNLPAPIDGSKMKQLASDVAEYKGDTHEEGGIKLSNNIEIEHNEVIDDNKVLSDRLYPSTTVKNRFKGLSITLKPNDTYAKLASKLGDKKGFYEERLKSTRIGEAGTAKLTLERYDKALDILFEDQQENKMKNNIGQFGLGGAFDPPEKDTQGKTSDKKLKWNDNKFNELFTGKSEFNEIRKKNPNVGTTYVFDRADYDRLNSYDNSLPADHPLNSPSGAKARAEFAKNPYAQQIVAGELNWNALGKNAGTQFDILSVGTNGEPTQNTQANNSNVYSIEQQRAARAKKAPIDYSPGSLNLSGSTMGRFSSGEKYQISFPSYGKGGKFANGDKFFDYLSDNSGDIYNGIGYIANQAQINRVETGYTPELVKNPAFTYRDRTDFLRNEFGKQFTTASKGLNQSSGQDNIALKANMYASTLNGLNGALSGEAQRKDNLDAYYNQLANRTSAQNAQILNYNKEYGINARNNKRALTQNNGDSLIRGAMGNKTQRDLMQLDYDKAYLSALASGDRGVVERMYSGMTPAMRKRLFGIEYNPTKK